MRQAKRLRIASAVLGVVTASVTFGCGDDEASPAGAASGTGATGAGAAGAAGGAGGAGAGGAGGESVTFIVVESLLGEPTAPPVEGAMVAFDAPGGERVEQSSGADGKVTFTGVDWSKGKAAVSAYLTFCRFTRRHVRVNGPARLARMPVPSAKLRRSRARSAAVR